MENKDQTNNPYDLCIFRSESECETCHLKNQLDCHFSLKKLLRFIISFLFIIITGSAALIIYGLMKEIYVFLVLLAVFFVIFFEFWEIRILCSHCPFYAENQKKLRCYANYGSLKVWKYHPEPMSISEKIQLMVGFLLFISIVLLPSIILIVNQHYLWAVPPIIGLLAFGYIIKKFHCTKCLNFSCPFNDIPKAVVDEFLNRNPVMKKAWEEKGW